MESSVAEASAPASSANLGPGFDCLAIALDLRCRVVAERADEWSVRHVGAQCPDLGAKDAVLRAARLALGDDRPLKLTVANDIPIGKGLGSSSAAAASGGLAAWRAVGEDHSPERLFQLVSGIEGHPDNAAAAVYGGLVLTDPLGVAHRLPWNPRFGLLVLVPRTTFSTTEARAVLPDAYPRSTVVSTVARSMGLVAGLLSGDTELLRTAAGDEIHEGPRNSHRPEVGKAILAALDAGAVHAAWSGAGPSVLAIVEAADRERVAGVIERAALDVNVLKLELASRGAV